MDRNNSDQRHQKRGRQARLYDKTGAISPRRKDEHQYTGVGKGEITSPNRRRLLPLWVMTRSRPFRAYVSFGQLRTCGRMGLGPGSARSRAKNTTVAGSAGNP